MQRYNALMNFHEILYNLLRCSYIPVQCRGQRDPHRRQYDQFPSWYDSSWYGSSLYGSSWYDSSPSGFPCLAYVRDRRGAPWLLNWTLLNDDLTCAVAETRTPRSLLQTGFIFRPTYLIGQIARRRCSDSDPSQVHAWVPGLGTRG